MLRLYSHRLSPLLARHKNGIIDKLQIADIPINLRVLFLSQAFSICDKHFVVLRGTVKQINWKLVLMIP